MFCPKCRAEYPSGTLQCLECQVALQEDFHGLKDGILFVQVMEIKRREDVVLVKRLLNKAAIQHYVQGEYLNSIEPDEFPAYLMVQSDRLNEATDLLVKTRVGREQLKDYSDMG